MRAIQSRKPSVMMAVWGVSGMARTNRLWAGIGVASVVLGGIVFGAAAPASAGD